MSRTLAATTPIQVGRWGEDIALTILRCNSYSLLERNWRPRTEPGSEPIRGEIDLVMIDPEMNLVFVEVKTRSSELFGHPLEAISRDKSQKLRALAYAWSRSHETQDYRSMRIDAVSICGKPQHFTFEHLTGVA
ncbi:YraN family protein [Rothia endophytica]|uniref:YraN family protein n=1 Tax=Rothia endophytica TaxID=1324766 RepID=UPI001F1E3439|nr:YraN family protein [Rothia endophytica]